jgi:hypothetical protein
MRRRDVLGLPALLAAPAAEGRTRGAYATPKPFWDRGYRLDQFGINAVFVHGGSITGEMIRRARAEGARVFAEFATWNGSKAPPEALPIGADGNPSPKQTWFQGICPTYEPFLQERLAELEKLITTRDLDGVWLDYLHWHAQFEDPEPGLPETCFNASCLERFRRDTGVMAENPREILGRREREWREWRCSMVVDFARRCRAVLRKHKPQMLLGNYHCAWRDDEHGGARRRILGLDVAALDKTFDVLSPMVYHGRSGRPQDWVRRNVEWWSRQTSRAKIWPIVQAWNDPKGHRVSAPEFEQVLRAGLRGRADGVMMFTLGAVAEDPDKLAVLKKVYLGSAA